MIICYRCNKECVSIEGAPGYGSDAQGHHFCYKCCAVRDIEQMKQTGTFTGYLSFQRGWSVSNWPGSLRFPLMGNGKPKKGRHNWRGVNRYDAWFVGPDGFVWHAINIGDNEIARCKRTQRRWIQQPHGGYKEVR